MKRIMVAFGCAAAVLMLAGVSAAQGRGGGPKPKISGGASHGPKSQVPKLRTGGGSTSRPKLTAGGGSKVHGPRSGAGGRLKVQGPKGNTGGTKHTTKSTVAGGGKKTKTFDSTSTTKSRRTTSTEPRTGRTTNTDRPGSTSPAETATLSKVQQKLLRNTNLASKLQSRLPAGTDLMTAAEGFRNLGQFVAAVNVSHNHNLDFEVLKLAMVDEGMSLGQAMKAQRQTLDGTTAVRAQRDADALIASTDTTARSTSTARTKPRTKDGRR